MEFHSCDDTICAEVASGAIGMVRVTGHNAQVITRAVAPFLPVSPEHAKAYFGRFFHGDEGYAIFFKAGRSYTGDETVELTMHGSTYSIQSVLDELINNGARMAGPGEFTLRSFMNGRIDLTQAEGVLATVAAETERQFRAANLLRHGLVREEIERIRSKFIGYVAEIEANTDFGEEIGDGDFDELRERLIDRVQNQSEVLTQMLHRAEASRALVGGVSVALVGAPNVGKSSLLNALLRSDRAIVSETPGTTRDFIEVPADFRGFKVTLVDTAGLRETEDALEFEGVNRTRHWIQNADLVLFIFDAGQGYRPEDRLAYELINRPKILVANKCDLADGSPATCQVSAKTGAGLKCLVDTVLSTLNLEAEANLEPLAERHAPLLASTLQATDGALASLKGKFPLDIVAIQLREAIYNLGIITGETATPDILERIFADFCIGK
jgi:tRNA modification GTPase